MGIGLLTNVALSFILVGNFKKSLGDEFDFDYFWKRAVTAAVGASIIAKKICRNNDHIFIAALLHDIGILIASICLPSYRDIFDGNRHDERSFNSVEQDRFGLSHAELGSEILSLWGLPEKITTPIVFHQQPHLAPSDAACSARVINLADKLSAVFHGRPAPKKLKEFREELNQNYNLSDTTINKLIEEISEQNSEILSFFDIPGELTKSAAQILQEANETLSNLNLSNHQLANQYQQEKEQAQKASAELSAANAELSRMAFQDSLTGLYNLRYLHDHLDRELQRAARYNSVFSFIMFDIDDFKRVNDTYGHQAGDKMLQQIATTSLNTMRNTDVVARYGGEEFAIFLPETTLAVAAEIAERLRTNIDQISMDWKGEKISVTISLGISLYCPKTANLTKNQIIAIADAGLYRSKKNGKNRVSLPQ